VRIHMRKSTLTPEGYLPRVADAQIERYLRVFGAVEVAGPKWCGKTWSSLAHASSVVYVDEGSNTSLARADPSLMLEGEQPHVIDEWQRAPGIWNAVRHAVDAKRGTRGAFILTGSSTPLAEGEKQQDAEARHSGAGRIGRIRMAPMTLYESGDSTGRVSLAGLFRGEFSPCRADGGGARALVELICRGGWPEVIDMSAVDALLVSREYLASIWAESMPRMRKRPQTAERLAVSLARNLGQSVTYKTLVRDMYGSEEEPSGASSDDTIADYLSALRSLYLYDELHGWVPPARSPKRLAVKPKRYLADPSLAVALLGMGPDALLEDWQTFGLTFENLAVRDLQTYARALPDSATVPVRYYRDDSGLEVDVIIELLDGRWAAIEIKTSEEKVDEGLAALRRLKRKLTANPASRVRPPEFVAVVVGISEFAREVDELEYVLPIRCLGA
jgi:predicted AAA+ superfamily ATPase